MSRKRQRAPRKRPRKVRATPPHIQAMLAEAAQCHRTGDLRQAETLYLRALDKDIRNADGWHNLGLLLVMQERLSEGIGPLETAARLAPDNPPFLLDLGNAYLQSGRPMDAEQAYRQILERRPRYLNAHYNLGNLLARGGDLVGAREAYETALEIDPDRPEVCLNLAGVYEAEARYAEANDLIERAARLAPEVFVIHASLGGLRRKMGDLDGAVAAYSRAAELAPDKAVNHAEVGCTLHAMDRYEEAETHLRRALAIDPELTLAEASLGAVLFDSGRLDEATEVLRALTEREPDSHEALTRLGNCYEDLGDLEAAVDVFARAAAIPSDGVNRASRRYCLAHYGIVLQQLGRHSEASAVFDLEEMVQVRRLPEPPGWPSLDAFHAGLIAHILGHPTLEREPAEKSTKGGSQTLEFLKSDAPEVVALREQIAGAITQFADMVRDNPAISVALDAPERFDLTGWAVVLGSGGHQSPHIHPAAFCSGVYYVQVPDAVAAGGVGDPGCLVLGRSQPVVPDDESQAAFLHRIIKPEPGMIVLFPSHVWHHTIPFESGTERICVAFDAIQA